MIIYIDVLILVNFIVNLFILHITVQTLRKKVNLIWMCLSSFLGSLYVLTVVYPKFKYLSYIPFKILIVIVMILIVFREKSILFNIKASLIFIFYSILLAGMCFYIAMSNSSSDTSFNVIIINFPYEKLMLSVMVIYIFIYRMVIFIGDRKKISTLIYTIDIVNKNYKKTIKAFLDTGNELREPATNLPVLIVEREILNEIILEENNTYQIPYTVVNGTNGKLIGFKPQYVNIHIDKNIETRDVIIAFCEYKLSKDNDYNGLMSRGILS